MPNLREYPKTAFWLESVLHSYSQVFFSLDKVFAGIILLVTFLSPRLGVAGLSAVLLSNLLAHLAGFNRTHVREGLYGFNALLLGLALGYGYEFNSAFVLLFVFAILLLLILTVGMDGFLGKRQLPFLSLPFLFTFWVISLATTSLANVHADELHSFTFNETMFQQSSLVFRFAHSLDQAPMPEVIKLFFRTLSSTFFNDSVVGGMLLAGGLLYFSRIAFSLSIIGFSCAFLFYSALGADGNDLASNLAGANFIFLAIALGCFYVIPNPWSYLTVVLLTPVMMLLLIFFNKVFLAFHLKTYTLTFCILVPVFLYFLQQRLLHRFLQLVTKQYYSAEKTIYQFITSQQRFRFAHLAQVHLPFWGEWMVSQGHEGRITHLGDWSKALDFVILDAEMKTYRDPGQKKEDFYCFGKPVLAPMDGYIYDIVNSVDDNDISDVNVSENWGNTIIINHLNGLFSQLSHLRKDSMRVKIGDYVTKGTVIATCGNSGRSPEPHIHFQLQGNPKVGAKTLDYPIAYFIERRDKEQRLCVSEVPREGCFVSNVEVSPLLLNGFSLQPGKRLRFVAAGEGPSDELDWEVFTDAWNRSYIFCHRTKAQAFFVNDGTMFYFTHFEGDKDAVLFQFYLAAYRILLASYLNISVNDQVPLDHFSNRAMRLAQDVVAPFYLFTKAVYTSACTYVDVPAAPAHVILNSSVDARFMGRSARKLGFEIVIKEKRIARFGFTRNGKTSMYLCAE